MSKKPDIDFATTFKALTGCDPFPWQQSLYERFISDRLDNIPASCNLPTGLGKTSVIAIWLIALATHPTKMPRRLVYVVNRRTVVDQTTDEVEKYRTNLVLTGLREKLLGYCAIKLKEDDSPLALSTLRGQFADNREWSADPSRPAVVCGTVDMIGSRLLFSGYGIGFKSKPLHAGFLGQDVLLVHDEAHLEPAFQELLLAIEEEQKREKSQLDEKYRLKVMELSATSWRTGNVFTLTAKDESHNVVKKRIQAKKEIVLHELDDDKKLPERLAELALKHKDSKRAVLVFARTVGVVQKAADRLEKSNQTVEILTGTLRGKERDALVKKTVFRRFLPNAAIDDETVYLVCTSAGEVGVNISADHLICDLSTFESMAQRFGRVNRFGVRDDSSIDIVHPADFDDDNDLEASRRRTLALLQTLNGDGSPKALSDLDPVARADAFSPQPDSLPTSNVLFDAWALTSVRERLPGRPSVEAYLHGISEWEPPETCVAWRSEVDVIKGDLLVTHRPKDLLDDYPLKPHELLRGRTSGKGSVFEHLEVITDRDAQQSPENRLSAWVVDPDGMVTVYPLLKLIQKDKLKKPVVVLDGCTVVLPPQAGGLSSGLLSGESPAADDVADDWFNENEEVRRCRAVWDDDEPPPHMRLVRTIDTQPDADDDSGEATGKRLWRWYVRPMSADDDGSKFAEEPITWQHHTDDVVNHVVRLGIALELPQSLQRGLMLAAKFHDLGKKRAVWQRSIGNPNPTDWYAKSGKRWNPSEISDFRHEFGSLIDLKQEIEFQEQPEEIQDLILHLIAVHHGRGRPHFPSDEIFDPERPQPLADQIACEIPSRFARLQRKYGRWGLAYLESLLRAADYAASSTPSEVKS